MTTKIKLSTITPVELRDCWQSESSDFTPWLAQEENMKLLAEAINIDELEVIAQEEYVGPYRADILCKETGTTCRIVYLNGSVDKAVGQDARRERSGGADFVIDYATKIDKVWERLIDPQSEEYFKNNGIYNIYEFKRY